MTDVWFGNLKIEICDVLNNGEMLTINLVILEMASKDNLPKDDDNAGDDDFMGLQNLT